VLADDQPAVVETGVDHDPLAGIQALARAVGAEDPRLRDRGLSAADPEVDSVQGCGPEPDEYFTLRRRRIGRVLVAENLGSPVLVNPDRFHRGTIFL
jgi:hypothetical protein